MALTSNQKARLESLKNQIAAFNVAKGPGWEKAIKDARDELKKLMAIKKQKPKPKKVEKKLEPVVTVEEEEAKGPPKPKRKPIRKPLVKKDQSGKKLIELAKRDELKEKQKRAKFYQDREEKRLAKLRKAANERVRKISPTQTSQLVAPSKRKEGAGARYIREQREAKDKAKDRRAGEIEHFKQLKKERVNKKADITTTSKQEVPKDRSGLAQFWKDITDLPSNLAKDFLPKQIKGSKEEDYTQDLEDMGPGKRKYKWGDMEFTLDTTREEMTKGRPTESHKKGGRIKKGAKKTKARKRAALRGHRAELRGG